MQALRRAGSARIASVLWALGGALLAAQAARIHPSAWLPVALVPFAIVAAEVPGLPEPGAARRVGGFVVGGILVAAVVVVTSGAVLAGHLDETGTYEPAAHLRALWTLIPLAIIGLAVARPRWPIVPALASLGAALVTRAVYDQSHDWVIGYDRLFAPMVLVGAAALLPAERLRVRTARLLVGGALLLLALVAARDLRRRTTDQLEYAWLRPRLAAIPAGCRVVWVDRAGQRVLALPEYLIPRAPGEPRAALPVHGPGELPEGCVDYYRSSLCTSDEGRPVCDAVERGLSLERIDGASFPPVPSNRGLPYDRPTVDVALSRVTRR
jgi:hypothetical protein